MGRSITSPRWLTLGISCTVAFGAWAQSPPKKATPPPTDELEAVPIAPMKLEPVAPLTRTPPAEPKEDALDEEELEKLTQELTGTTPQPTAIAPATGGQIRGNGQLSLLPDIALILDVAGAYFTDDEPLQTGSHDPRETGFNLQQLELHMESGVDPYFRLDANIVFALFGVEVEEAFATSLGIPGGIQIRAGQFFTRFGRINPTHPHSWNFADQPIVNGKFFGGEGSRGLGFEISWLAPTPWYLEFVTSMTMANGACCARSFYGGNDPGVDGIEDFLYTAAIKQFFPLDDDWSLMWGLSGQFGPNPTGRNNRTEIYGTDLYLRYRPVDHYNRAALSIQAEAMFRTRQVPNDVLQDVGLYAQIVGNLTIRWELGARYEYVSGMRNDPLDPEWTGDRHRSSAQVTFYPSHFSRIRLQGAVDMPSYRPQPIGSVFLAVELLIGAHGAHKF